MSNLKAIKRERTSSGSNNKLRAEGLVPAILYGGTNPNQNISVQKKDLKNIINSDTFLSKVLELDIDGKKEKVIPRDVAFHVVSEEPIHIDFMRIVAGKKIILEINQWVLIPFLLLVFQFSSFDTVLWGLVSIQQFGTLFLASLCLFFLTERASIVWICLESLSGLFSEFFPRGHKYFRFRERLETLTKCL